MMTKLTLRGLWSHKHRFIGAAMAVFLGVAFLAGTLIVSDTLSSSIDAFLLQTYSGTDVVVRSSTQVTKNPGALRGTFPASTLTTVKAVPGVAEADPIIEGSGQLLDKEGNLIKTQGPRLASNWIPNATLNPWHVVEGRAPQAAGEVVIDRQTAKNAHLQLGDTTAVLSPQRAPVTIVGIAKFGSSDSESGESYVGMTLSDAQRYLTSSPDLITSISVQAAPGVSADELQQRVQSALPAGTEAITGAALAQEQFDNVSQSFLAIFRTFLVAFAGVALIVSLFSMYNTFSIIVAQRNRESAMLRALGSVTSTDPRVNRGRGTADRHLRLSRRLCWRHRCRDAARERSQSRTRHAGQWAFDQHRAPMIISIATGILVTLVASVRPALQASRVPPMAAIRAAVLEETSTSGTGTKAGLGLLVLGVGIVLSAVLVGSSPSALLMAGLGALATLAGVILVSPAIAEPLSALIGQPAARLQGTPGRLARRNAMRSPRRTARAATALFLGVGVVTIFTVLVASLSAGLNSNVKDAVKSDLIISSGNLSTLGFSPNLVETVTALPDVRTATGIGTGSVILNGSEATVSTVDPQRVGEMVDLGKTSGAISSLGNDQLAVSNTTAKDNGWKIGTNLTAIFADGSKQTFTIGALFDSNTEVGDYLMPAAAWQAHDSQPRDNLMLINLKPGTSLAQGKAAVQRAVQASGAPSVQTKAEFMDSQTAMFGTILNVAYGLLAFAIVIALMGIGNTLALSTYERTREIGLLRAVGASQGQLRSMVRWESVIVAVFGTVTGILMGLFAGWGLAEAMAKNGRALFALPVVPIVVILIVGALAGVLASIRPAGRAAKLDILNAIATE